MTPRRGTDIPSKKLFRSKTSVTSSARSRFPPRPLLLYNNRSGSKWNPDKNSLDIRLAEIPEQGRLRLAFFGHRPGRGLQAFSLPGGEEIPAEGIRQEHQRRRDPARVEGGRLPRVRPPHRAPGPAPEPYRDAAPGRRSRSGTPREFVILESDGQRAEKRHGLPRHRPLRRPAKKRWPIPATAATPTPSPTAPTAARASPSSQGCPTTAR